MRTRVHSLALLSGSRIWRCRELWCRLQMRLGSCIAVAVVSAGSCSSNWTPSLGTSICRGSAPPKKNPTLMRIILKSYDSCVLYMFVLLMFKIKLPVMRDRRASLNLKLLVKWGRTSLDQQRAQVQAKEHSDGRQRVAPK